MTEKRLKISRLVKLGDNFKQLNIHVSFHLKVRREGRMEKNKGIMPENFPNLKETIYLYPKAQ